MSHTPGPWNACHDGACPCRQVWSMPADAPVFTARPDSNVNVGMAHHKWGDSPELLYGAIPPEQQLANARLIAAAPELLDALKHALERMKDIETGNGFVPQCSAAITYAEKAIAKAEGRPCAE